MSFQEKSAYIMIVILLLVGGGYFYEVLQQSQNTGSIASPTLPVLIKYTINLVILSIIGHIIIAGISSKAAEAKLDEREQLIFEKAGNLSGWVLGAGAVMALLHYLMYENGDILFYIILGSLLISALVEYIVRAFLYRVAF